MLRYKVELPSHAKCIVLQDVFMKEKTPDGKEVKHAVVVLTPVVITNGYLPIERFEQGDWEKSLAGGHVKRLIDIGVIKVEEVKQISSVEQVNSTKGEIEQSGESNVSPTVLPETNQIAQVTPGLVDIKGFSSLSFSEKVNFIKKCDDLDELKRIVNEEKPSQKFIYNCLLRKIKKLENSEK